MDKLQLASLLNDIVIRLLYDADADEAELAQERLDLAKRERVINVDPNGVATFAETKLIGVRKELIEAVA